MRFEPMWARTGRLGGHAAKRSTPFVFSAQQRSDTAFTKMVGDGG